MKKTFLVSIILFLITGLVFSQAVIKKQKRPVLTLKPKITVKYPNGGETLKRGQPHIIRWSSVGVKGWVLVQVKRHRLLSKDWVGAGPAMKVKIASGKYTWYVPNSLKGIHKARFIIKHTGSLLRDTSDADFTIIGKIKITVVPFKSIKIIVPPKKEHPEYITFYHNGRYAVMWKTTGKINNIGIKLVWRYGNEPPIVYVLAASTPNDDGRHDIVIAPKILALKYYNLVVYDVDNPKIKDSRTVNIKKK